MPCVTGNACIFAHSYNISGRLMIHLHNLSQEPREVRMDLDGTRPGRLHDVFEQAEPIEDVGAPIELEPYGYRWYRSDSC